MYDALFPDAADTALAARARRPVTTPDTPWFKGAWGAMADAPLRAGAEMARFGTTLLTPEAVGAVDAPTMFSAPGGKPKADIRADIRAQDAALRDAIKETTPDPNSTGAASMILHDVTRFVSKAVGYAALGGAPGAVAGITLDEGTNEALRRVDEGVDPATALKLGATKGIASGVAVALPVAGATWMQTLGLAAAGGPGAFITEQGTARAILQAAEYDELAGQIDPFDPVGLGVSFAGSFLFGAGARAMRGKGEVRIEPPPPEAVDAAHVAVLQGQREDLALTDRPEQLAEHITALERASEQLAAGERVEVGDVAPVAEGRGAQALEGAVTRLREVQEAPPVAEPAGAEFQPAGSVEARLAQIETDMPDLLVHMDGLDAPVPARQLLADIKAEADAEIADAPLLKVAAECALRG